MRIVFVIPYFDDAWAYGGQPRSAYEMAKGLVARGHTVEVLTTDSGGPHRLTIPHDGYTRVVEGIAVRYYRNLSNTLAFRYRVFVPLGFFRDVAQRVRGADVVHIHELRSLLGVSAASASVRQSIPFVLSPHGGLRHLGRRGLKTIFDSLWGRRILDTAAAVIAISPVEEQDARAMKVPDTRLFRVPNSIPAIPPDSLPREGVFRERHGLSAGRIVLFLGRLHAVKGADLLVEAFARSCRETSGVDTHLVLAGPDDGESYRLRQMVERFGIGDRVTFTGYLNETQKLEAFVDSRLIVVPSRSEVFAITAVEALMCSRPVLLSSACGLHPMPGEGHGVRLFRTDSVEDLALQLASALDNTQLLECAGRGRAFVEREFSGDVLAGRLETVYQTIG
jgi:glycosyltransferase involved in cell wall biosynthesis